MGKVKKVILTVVIIFIGLMVLSVVVATLFPTPSEPPKKVVKVEKPKPKPKVVKPKPKQKVDLKTTVRFDGKQFTIVNQNSFDWTSVKLEVNSGLISSGYILRQSRLKAKTTYTVGALQFAKPDGQRLNPYTTKVLNMTITCDIPKERGFWYGGWE